jgi:hypothetical protein
MLYEPALAELFVYENVGELPDRLAPLITLPDGPTSVNEVDETVIVEGMENVKLICPVPVPEVM